MSTYVNQVVAVRTGAEPVSEVGIRRYVEAHELTCPLYFDRAAARTAGYEDIIAPWSMLLTMAMSAYWKPGDPPLKPGALPPFAWDAVDLPGDEMMSTNIEVEYFAPLNLGDVVTTVYRVTNITPKRTRVGDGHFIDFELTFTNQHGTKLAIEHTTVYRYSPLAASHA